MGFARANFLERLELSGFPPITKSLGALVLTTLLNHSSSAAPTVMCCHPVDWKVITTSGPPYMLKCDLSCFAAVKDFVEPEDDAATTMTEDMKRYAQIDSPQAR